MFIRQEIYGGKMTDILYPEQGYILKEIKTNLLYGSVSLEDGRTKEQYTEVKEEEDA